MRNVRTATAGLVLAVGLSGATVGLAGTASASPAQPRPQPVKVYRTWAAAQKAAGFRLVRPARTDGLKRRGGVLVTGCLRQRRSARHRDRQVTATYSSVRGPAGRMITFGQANAPRVQCPELPVPGGPGGKIIARVRVDGATATLRRAHVLLCLNRPGHKPKCSSAALLQLSWSRHRHFYRVNGLHVRRAPLIAFARGLAVVR
jgi:hypothetical protein